MNMLVLFLLLFFVLAASAFFAGIETGIISINRLRLQHLARRNVFGAARIRYYITHADILLSTTLIGTNLCHVISAVLTASISYRFGGTLGVVIGGIILMLVTLIGCEYLPKAWFRAAPASRTLPLAGIFHAAALILYPASFLVNQLLRLLLPGERGAGTKRLLITREELLYLTRESVQSGALTKAEFEMIHGVFQLTHKTCGAIMTPRDKMIVVQHTATVEEAIALARQKSVSRFPVFHTQRQEFIGVIHIFDLLADSDPQNKTVEAYIRRPEFIEAYMPADHLLPRMRLVSQPLFLVNDNRNEVIGLITLEDVLEEITGET